jgi:hypothetical protein
MACESVEGVMFNVYAKSPEADHVKKTELSGLLTIK